MSNHAEKKPQAAVRLATRLQASSINARDTLARELDEAVRCLHEATDNAPAANKQAIRHALLW